ncbi:MAG: hypothetical protein ABJZ55_15965 [Fuerstiella sp.]
MVRFTETVKTALGKQTWEANHPLLLGEREQTPAALVAVPRETDVCITVVVCVPGGNCSATYSPPTIAQVRMPIDGCPDG